MLWLASACLCVCHVLGTSRPNIIVIFADDLGWNDVGYHGSNEIPTPNIDALAYNGIMLERHYTSPSCTPSRTAFYTGKYPFRIGMQGPPIGASQPRGIPLNETLMPEYLRSLGYKTHLVGKWHVGHYTFQHTPTYRGFDTFFGYWLGYVGYFNGLHETNDRPGSGRGSGMDAHRNTKDAWQEFVGKYATDVFTKEAVQIINDHDTANPLFLQVMHLAPHAGNHGHILEVRDLYETLTKYSYIQDYNRRLYAGMVEALDDSVGQIVASLKAKGILDNSIIMFMSDNGAPTVDPKWQTNNYGSNWPLRGLKSSLHEGGVRVPAVIYSPLLHNNISNQLFHMTDWLPTLYQAAGGDISSLGPIDGVSQWDALKKPMLTQPPRQYVPIDIDETLQQQAVIVDEWKAIKCNAKYFVCTGSNYYGSAGRIQSIPEYNFTSVVTSPANRAINSSPNLVDYKYKRHEGTIDSSCKLVVEDKVNDVTACNEFCLFNIHQDPCETTDLSKKYPDKLKELTSLLQELDKFRVPRNNFTVDYNAHPSLWNNRWVPWLDPQYKIDFLTGRSGSVYGELKVIVYVLIITVLSKLCLFNRVHL